MTWSIVAYDRRTGEVGVAVTTRSLAVGGLAPYGAGGRGALSTQARVNPLYGIDGLSLLAEGRNAGQTLAILLERDEGREYRQLHLVDAHGNVAAHTGRNCITWAGHAAGDGVSVAGNMLTGEAVVAETLAHYEQAKDQPLGERLIGALDAGQAAGGDARGAQSAAIKIWRQEPYAVLDLRTDDHPQPLVELRRLYVLAQERYIAVMETMGTRAHPAGIYETAAREDYLKMKILR